MRTIHLLLAGLAIFLSGASTLTYEIVWQRQLFLIFGASAPATTAILTAIFLGIAFGSRLARNTVDRSPSPARFYAGLELLIGCWGMIVPLLLTVSNTAYRACAVAVGEDSPALMLIRFVLAILPLLPATLAMGATVPVLIKLISTQQKSRVAIAYGLNTLGAMCGCLLTGLVWIRWLGLGQTRFVAVAFNALAALALILIHRQTRLQTSAEATVAETRSEFQSRAWLQLGYFLAGLVALGLEVVWLRFLGIVNSNSTITFTFTLAVYLLGMSLGSLILYPLLRRYRSAAFLFVLANFGVAATALLTCQMIYAAVEVNHHWIIQPSVQGTLTLAHIYQAEGLITSALVFLPTLLMGLVYPAVCELGAGENEAPDRWHAHAYFWGTLGSVAGILIVATLIIPAIGLHRTLVVLVGLSVLLGVTSSWVYYPRLRPISLLLTIGLMGWAVGETINPQPVLRDKVARYENGRWTEYSLDNPRQPVSVIVHRKAGRTATVLVKKDVAVDEHFVYVDDQLVASTNIGAKVDAVMLAHLPLLLHPDPENALTVGFGSGGTSYAMTTHEIPTYCVEIEPEVPAAADYLVSQNFRVQDHPDFHLILNDARDHLHITTRRYDVISTDVTNLQYKQNSNLYTVEYFQLMKHCLRDDGVACAWIPMAAITTSELQTLMASFQNVFPHATLWLMNHTHTNFGILIGTPEPLVIDYHRLQHGFQNSAIAENLRTIGVTSPLQVIHSLHLDEAGYRQFCGAAPLHTDNRPILEFTSPMSFYQYYETFRDNLRKTLKYRPKDHRPFVRQLTADAEANWEKHDVAADCFCQVMLEAYNFIVYRGRGQRERALQAALRGLDFAKQGMSAFPEDVEREKYYDEFVQQVFP